MGLSNALAENKLQVKDAFATLNGKAALAIDVVIEKDNFVGYQFDMTLPNTLSLSLNDANKVIASSYTELDIDGNVMSSTETTTTYRIIASKMGNPTIPTGTYTLLSLTMETDGSLEVGDVVSCFMSGITFSDNTNQGTNFEDVNFNVTITDRVILDENSTVAPVAQSGVNVLVKRTIKAGHWNTIVLPFTLTSTKAKSAFGDDVQLAQFTSFETDYGEDEENITPLGIVINLSNYTIPRTGWKNGVPMLIKVSDNIESFTVDNVTISSGITEAVKEDEANGLSGKLTGTLVKTTIPEDGLFINSDQFWYSAGKTTTKAFRCWFELDAVLNKATDFPESRVTLNFNGEATGIQDNNHETITNNREIITNNRCYDLQGRWVDTPAKKGLYIRNGRKEVVK